MSKMKKIASVLLAVVMVLALNVTVLAADTTEYTITINYSGTGHIYEAYQIFSGTLGKYEEYTGIEAPTEQVYTCNSATGKYTKATYVENSSNTYYVLREKVLSDIQWGSGVDGDGLLAALKAETAVVGQDSTSGVDITVKDLFASCTTAADVAAVLSANNTNKTLAESFAQLASENLSITAGKSSENSSPYTIKVKGAGYYLIRDDASKTLTDGSSFTEIILEVVADVTVDAKADTTTVDKKVDSSTDSDNETTADYDIGDNVPFTLTATLPSNYASYSEYKLTFHDTLSSGLSFNNDVKVVVYTEYTAGEWGSDTYYAYDSTAGTFSEVGTTAAAPSSGTTYYTKTTVNSGYSVETASENLTDGCTFEVRIADVNNLTDDSSTITIESTSKIVVEYTAKLQSTAATKEENKVKLEYSNNPNDDGSGTGTTTEDITTVFTFTLGVNKFDDNNVTKTPEIA